MRASNGHPLRVVVLALAVCLLPAAQVRAQDDPRAEIQELLDARAAAVTAGDREAFLATVAGDPNFEKRQRFLFEGLQSIPLGSYELTVNWARAGDLVRPSDERRYPDASDVAIPITEERYTLGGIDDVPALEDFFYTFVLTDEGWRIAADDDLEDIGLFSARHLWDDGDVAISTAGRFLLFEHPSTGPGSRPDDDIPGNLLRTANASLRTVEKRLPGAPMPEQVAILAPGSIDELARILQATYELDNFLAFAASTVDTSKGFDLTGHRILMNWDVIKQSNTDMGTILTHELVHIATRELAGAFTPSFVDEGIAEHVAQRGDASSLDALRSAVESGTFDRRLPDEHEFRTGGPASIFLSYKESESAIGYLIERWGRAAFLEFYRELGAPRVAAGTARFHVDRALRAAIGIGLERFERAWADSIA